MTGNSITAQSPQRSKRECARDLISAGNTLESVASVFGMSVDGLRSMIEQPGNTAPIEAPAPALAQPWHRFPGNGVYPCPNYDPAILLAPLLIFLVVLTWKIFISLLHQHWFGLVVLIGLPIIALAVANVMIFLSARASRFEMHADAVALHTRAGCTVLPYVDIVGLTRSSGKGGKDEIRLLTRRGVGLTIAPRRVHMRDRRLSAWLASIPESADTTQAAAADHRPRYAYILPACQLVLSVLIFATSIRNTYMANLSMQWPTTDGIVTESVSLSGGGKSCRRPLRFHYLYTIKHQQYAGSNYRFGGVCDAESASVAAANPVGKHVAVHYRPGDPAQSVVVPGGLSYTFEVIALVMTALTMLYCWRASTR